MFPSPTAADGNFSCKRFVQFIGLNAFFLHLFFISIGAISENVIANLDQQIDLHIVVLTGNHIFEIELAQKLRNEILRNRNLLELKERRFDVTLLQQKFVPDENSPNAIFIEGYWAIWPAIQRFTPKQKYSKWTIFCSPFTQISNMSELIDYFLTNFDHFQSKFIGNTLTDESPTVIHHYHDGYTGDGQRFVFPDISNGFAISRNVLQKILTYLQKDVKQRKFHPNFIIDPGFEFAQLVFEAAGILIENNSKFCNGQQINKEKCLVDFHLQINQINKWRKNANIFYAVKTHSANHQKRVPYIKQTWGNFVKPDIGYFSDEYDAQIPTINLKITNTIGGHCGKTFAIFRYFLANLTASGNYDYDWLMLADDDTLLSINRLETFIQSLPRDEPMISGQCYGYGFSVDGTNGYDYPTGGSGILFSRSAVEKIINSCDCPTLDSPDDMIIGICARRLSIPIIHSAAFHQARPIDYPKGHLQTWNDQHISFHKFEEIDPMQIYNEFLSDDEKCEGECGEEFTGRTKINRTLF